VLEVPLGGLDEVRDQIVAALQLDVDLSKGVPVPLVFMIVSVMMS
jgi:hypothetical protein